MKTSMHRYRNDEDYWRIREFLRNVLLANDLNQTSWDVARFDYWRWHGVLNMKHGTPGEDVFLWDQKTTILSPYSTGKAQDQCFCKCIRAMPVTNWTHTCLQLPSNI